MSAELRSLVWKEWRERRSALVLCTAWIVCGVAYAATQELALGHRAPVGSYCSTCLLYGLVAPLFLAMRTALGETTQRTIGFSSALPLSLRRIAAVRACGATLTLTGPIVLGALLLSLMLATGLIEQAAPRPPYVPGAEIPYLTERPSLNSLRAVGLLWTVTAVAIAAGVQLLLILCVIGVRRRAEAHLGFIGTVVAFVWFLSMTIPRSPWLSGLFPRSLVLLGGYRLERGGYTDLLMADAIGLSLAVNLLILIALGICFTLRYASRQFSKGDSYSGERSWRLPALLSRLPMRWPNGAAALLWLDLRQALPLAIAGLGLACVMAVANIGFSDGPDPRLPERVMGELPGGTWVVALLWGAVVGSGIFAAEVQPGLGHFWRSRPISPSAWFWVKYAVGLVALLGVLDGVTILVSWNSPYGSGPSQMSRSYVACKPAMHAAVYSLAVLAVCTLRRPVLAGFLAISAVLLISMTIDSLLGTRGFEPIDVYNNLFDAERKGVFDLTAHHYPVVYGSVVAITLTATLFAWRASRQS